MKPVEERTTSTSRSYSVENVSPSSSLSNSSHRVPPHSTSSTNSFGQEQRLPDLSSNASSSSDHESHYVKGNEPIQMPPVQPAPNRKPSLLRIPGSVSDRSSLRSPAKPPRLVRFNYSEQQVMPHSEKRTNTPAVDERTDETQKTQDSQQERNSSQGEELPLPQSDSPNVGSFRYCTLS